MIFNHSIGRSINIRVAVIALLALSVFSPGVMAVELTTVYQDLETALQSGRVRHPGFDQAWTVLKPLAEAGDLMAMLQISHLFRLGVGGAERNARLARALVIEAAEQGLAEAQHQLAYNYERGVYGVIDNKQAVSWYNRAGEAGSCNSIDRLAKAWQYGELDLAKDEGKSAQWAEKKATCKH